MLKKIIFMFVIFLCAIHNNIFAATKDDVIIAINKTYIVGDETFRLPQEIITKGENYLNKNPLTPDKYDNILRCIDNAYALAKEMGTTDISKYSKEDINRALTILIEASDSANIDLNKELAESNISIPINNDTPIKNEAIKEKNSSTTLKKEDILIDNKQKDEVLVPNIKPDSDISEEVLNSGDQIHIENISGENFNSGEMILEDVISVSSNEENIDVIIERNINICILILVIILVVFILLLCLILKMKWNKIIKCVLVIIFAILIIAIFVFLILFVNYIEELNLICKLYYMLK